MPLRELVSTRGNRAIPIGEREYRLERPLYRTAALEREGMNAEARTVPLTFSSEAPVERWFGAEILDHSPPSVRLGRLRTGGPLCVDHDWRSQVGVIDSCEIGTDRRGRAVVRFGRSARAEEEFQDVQDGIRQNVSVGYMIHRMILEESSEEDGDTYRVVDWEPYEVSLVSVPADITVGVGRSAGSPRQPHEPERLLPPSPPEERTMPEPTVSVTPPPAAPAAPAPVAAGSRDVVDILNTAAQYRGRVSGADDLARQHIEGGRNLADFRAALLERMGGAAPAATVPDPVDLRLSDGEQRQYSILRALRTAAGFEAGGLEAEVSRTIARQLGRDTEGIFVPMSLRRLTPREARVLVTTSGSDGSEVVATELGELIDLLRNRMVTRRLGARVMSGLVGNVAFPRQTSAATFAWVAENPGSDQAGSAAGLDQLTLGPKTGQATTGYTRQLLNQSSLDIEAFVRDDLTQITAIGIDLAAIAGTGANNQPTGILNTTGAGAVVVGSNGGAPTWAHVVGLETEVAVDNADIGTLAYLTNAKVRGKLRQTFRNATYGEVPIWQDGNEAGFGLLNGYRAAVSNQVPSNLTKGTSSGVCSAGVFGNWADLIIGEWGAMEIIVDPFTGKKQGLIEVTAFSMVDIGVRHPSSFAHVKDWTTT